MRKLNAIQFFAWIIASEFIFGGGNEFKIKGRVEDQIKPVVVENSLIPRKDLAWTSLSLKEELAIDGTDENLFGNIRTLRVDQRGRVYLLDSRLARVDVFDPQGKKLFDFGKKGKGPREWILPYDMHIVSEDRIFVYDPGNARVYYFTLDGKFLSEISVGKLMPIMRVIPSATGHLIVLKALSSPEKISYDISAHNEKMEKLSTLATLESKRDKSGATVFFQPSFRYCVFGKHIIWGTDSKYQIHAEEDGREGSQRIINKEYEAVRIPAEEKQKEIKELEGANPREGANYVFPADYPAFDRFGVNDEGILYVRTYQKNNDGQLRYDFFDPNGNYVFSKFLGFLIVAWKNGKIYSIEENAGGFQVIKRYQATITGGKS